MAAIRWSIDDSSEYPLAHQASFQWANRETQADNASDVPTPRNQKDNDTVTKKAKIAKRLRKLPRGPGENSNKRQKTRQTSKLGSTMPIRATTFEELNLASNAISCDVPRSISRGIIPEVIDNVASEYAMRTGLSFDALATSMLTSISSAIATGIKVAAYKDANSKFVESIRIWQVNIGAAGNGKSPIIKSVIAPLRDIDDMLREAYNRELAGYQSLSKGEQREKTKPKRVRTILPDATTEAAQQTFADNPQGLLAPFDELIVFFGSMSRYSKTDGGAERSSRGFWLSTYDGARFSLTRANRGDVDCVPSCSILGGIQPRALVELFKNTNRNDSIIQRFNLVIMPDTMGPGNCSNEPQFPFTVYEQLITDIYSHCPLKETGAILHLNAKAELVRDRMFNWVNGYVEHQRSSDPRLLAHVSKFKGMFLKYCGLFHMIEHFHEKQARRISADTANRAYEFLTSFQLSHSENLYKMINGAAGKSK